VIPFSKLQAAGNAYVVVDGRGRDVDWRKFSQRICDPHLGVGSDGLAVVEDSRVAQVRMRIFNSDGSESEMSGNGIRLFAKFVLDRALAGLESGALWVETGGGVRSVAPRFGPRGVEAGRVAMGTPSFGATEIPVLSSAVGDRVPILDHPLEVAGRIVRVTCLAIGNPHAVALLDEPVDGFPLDELGDAVVHHPIFPNRINFEIVNVIDRATLRARVFERGEGETLASGTGSTASMIAAHLHGRVDDDVCVRLRGGELNVHWDGAGEAVLDGPTEEVCSGEWPDHVVDASTPDG
jgi:diaminopimelate epimerase